MTVERIVELFTLTSVFDAVATNGINRKGEFTFNGKVYDSKAMAKRQEELIEDFLSPFEVAEDAYVIEYTEKSE